MKNLVAIIALVFASVLVTVAQETPTTSQTNNEFVAAYSFLREDVKIQRPALRFETNTDSHGFNASYTRYVYGGTANKAAVVGFTADFGANFDTNEASLVTLAGGVTVKARNSKYIQPYVRVLGGVARQNVVRFNLLITTDYSGVGIVGTGVDFNTKAYSRYKVGLGADYVNTGFNVIRQHGARFTARFVF